MKELSLLSLICSCFHTQPHPNTIYQYGGRYPGPAAATASLARCCCGQRGARQRGAVPSRSSNPCPSPGLSV